MNIRVCVIGAGAGGLNALRHLTAKPHVFKAVAYEQMSVIGGTWVYTEKTGTDEHGLPVHSSMYKNLRTNLPKEVMSFPDFLFPDHGRSYIQHGEVLKYLEDYADHFNLRKFIKFQTKVEKVSVIKTGDADKTMWNVQVSHVGKNTSQKYTEESQFDAVIVCNGHYSVPILPEVPGLQTFKGKQLHSHSYRHPEDFDNQIVLCLGAGPSGTDIALDLAPHAKQVYLSHRKAPMVTYLPDNVQQVAGITSVDAHTVQLEDGTSLHIDTLMFCTGYHYIFPFLDNSCHLQVNDERVTPLYQHLIHTEFPTMCFIGLPKSIIPFPLFDCQLKFFLASLTGDMKLPSRSEMDRHAQQEFENMLNEGVPSRLAHKFADFQWEYNDRLAELAGFQPIPRVTSKLYNKSHTVRRLSLPIYKTKNYRLVNETEFEELDDTTSNL